MTFQALEKRLEICWTEETPSLRHFGFQFWENVVTKSRARILSHQSNNYCDAYLLSESSLFVWERRVVMITCGQSELHRAFEEMCRWIPSEARPAFLFETALLNSEEEFFFRALPNTSSLVLGETESNSLLLVRSSFEPFSLPRWKWILEGLHSSAQTFFSHQSEKEDSSPISSDLLQNRHEPKGCKAGWDPQSGAYTKVREHLWGNPTQQSFGVVGYARGLLLGFGGMVPTSDLFSEPIKIDEHLFYPMGYSCNLLENRTYAALHVTPEPRISYASFEGNFSIEKQEPLLAWLLEKTQPKRFQLLLLGHEKMIPFSFKNYAKEENTCFAWNEKITIQRVTYQKRLKEF